MKRVAICTVVLILAFSSDAGCRAPAGEGGSGSGAGAEVLDGSVKEAPSSAGSPMTPRPDLTDRNSAALGTISPQGGTVTSVTAGSGMTGGGTSGALTLNVIAATGGGLVVSADSLGMRTDCSSTEVLKWDGDSWECSVAAAPYLAGAGMTLTGQTFDVVATSGGGLTVAADSIGMLTSCNPNEGLVWSGSAWACSGTATALTGTGTTNTMAKYTAGLTLGNSLWTDDGTTTAYNTDKFTITASNGNTTVAGTLAATGAITDGGNRVFSIAGSGSTSSGATINIGAGTGITVNPDDVAITTNGVTDALLRQSAGLSVIGRAANTTGNVADITAGSDDQVLRRSGTSIGFGTVATGGITNDAVTYAKIQNVSATDRVLCRDTAAAGDIEECTVGGGLEFTGTVGLQRSALTGDVTATAGSNATTIANNAVSDAKLRDSAALSVIGRSANTSGDPADIAGTDGQVLRVSGTTLGFGSIPETSITGLCTTTDTVGKGDGAGGQSCSSVTVSSAGALQATRVSNIAVIIAGDDTNLTGATNVGEKFTAFNDGNIYNDAKLGNNGLVYWRIGHNTESGTARNWQIVTASTGAVSFPGTVTLGDAITDGTHVINGSAQVNQSSGGSFNVAGPASSYAISQVTSAGGAGNGFGAILRMTNTNSAIGELRMADTGSGTSYSAEASMLTVSTTAGYGIKLNTNAADNSGIRIASGSPGAVTIYGAANVNGNATLGDSTSADSHTINGSTALTSTGATNAFTSTYSGAAQTQDRGSINAVNSGSFNTTSTSLAAYAVIANANVSRSGGSNFLNSYGVYATAAGAAGGGGNTAVRGEAVSTSGNVGYGGYFISSGAGPDWAIVGDGADYNFYGANATGALYNAGAATIDGDTTLGNAVTDNHTVYGTSYMIDSAGTVLAGGNPSIVVRDSTAMAQGVGGSVSFDGNYTGSTPTTAAEIKAMKTNGTDGNFGFDLAFATRLHGGGLNEHFRILTTGQINVGDAGSVNVENDVPVIYMGNTGTGQTQDSIGDLEVHFTGSYNTSGGAKNHFASNITSEGTRSAGASAFNQVAVRAVAGNGNNGGDDTALLGVAQGTGSANYGVIAAATGATSAGNIAVQATASGSAGVNYSFYGTAGSLLNNGSVVLNNTSGTTQILGNTTIGDATTDSHIMYGFLDQRETVGTSIANPLNAQLVDDTAFAAGVGGGIHLLGKYNGAGNVSGVGIKAAKSNGTDGNYDFDMILGTQPNGGSVTERMRIGAGGAIQMGDVGASSIENNLAYVLALGQTGTGQTNNDTSVLSVSNTGTYNATAGQINVKGISVSSAVSRSAGANTVNNWAAILTASGAQLNYALQTNDGDVILNNSSGKTTANLNFEVNGSATLGNSATADAHTISGKMDWTSSWTGDDGLDFTWSPSSDTNSRNGIDIVANGTWNTTGGPYESIALKVTNTSTEGSGSTSLSSTAATFSASGGDGTNYAIRTYSGTVEFNNTDGTVRAYGGGLFGDTFSDQLVLNGWTYVNKLADEDVTNSAVLQADDYLAINVTSGKIYRIIGDLTVGGSSATADLKYDFAVLAGTMECTGVQQSVTTADAYQGTTVTAATAADTNDTAVGTRTDASFPIAVHIDIACKFSNTTQIQFRFAQNSQTASNSARVMAGSRLIYTVLN